MRIRLLTPPIDLFIYDDETGIQGGDIDLRFETTDYPGSNELMDAFLSDVRKVTEGWNQV